jgi:hypothetical protein
VPVQSLKAGDAMKTRYIEAECCCHEIEILSRRVDVTGMLSSDISSYP